MADQLNMGGLSLGPTPQEQHPPTKRSYIPPHMRGSQGPGPMGGPGGPGGPAGPAPGPGPMAGLNSSAWAK